MREAGYSEKDVLSMRLSQIKRRLGPHNRLLAIRRIEQIEDLRTAAWGDAESIKAHLDKLIALAK